MYQIMYDEKLVGFDDFDKNEVLEELIRIKRKFKLGPIERMHLDETIGNGVIFIESK